MFYKQFNLFMNTMYTLRANSLKRIHTFHVVPPCNFINIVSQIAITHSIVAINGTLTVAITGGIMSKVNVKPVLLNGEQIQALKTIQERERQKSGMGIAPSIHAVARKIFDAGLSKMEAGQ